MSSISEKEIAAFSNYILRVSGIYLDKSKGYLLETRLKVLMDECKVTSYSQLLDKIKADITKNLEKKLVDAISTNETFFFRDNVPFDLLRNKIIPDLIDLRGKDKPSGPIPIRIWSAACSTGQEAYSIAITLLEMLSGMGSFEIFILGTDISDKAIAQASYGKYNRFEIERGLPENKRRRYFTQSGETWRIKDEVRALAKFEKINLMKPFPPSVDLFDVVFCRNVAIYFQNSDKINLFKKIAKVIAPGGALIVGGSENLSPVALDFTGQQYLRGMYYTLKSDHKKVEVSTSSKQDPKKAQLARGKTVFDKKPKALKVEKKKPLLEKVDTSAFKRDNLKQPPVAPKPEKTVALQKASLPPSVKPDKGTEPPKTSLLSTIQGNRKQTSSLLGGKHKAKESKDSLLEKISTRKEK